MIGEYWILEGMWSAAVDLLFYFPNRLQIFETVSHDSALNSILLFHIVLIWTNIGKSN